MPHSYSSANALASALTEALKARSKAECPYDDGWPHQTIGRLTAVVAHLIELHPDADTMTAAIGVHLH